MNNVRGMLFTGTYKGRKISVMGRGMGIRPAPSNELRREENYPRGFLWRCSAARKLRDVVIGMGACTDSKVNRIRFKDR